MISTLAYHYKFVNSYSINTFFLPKNQQFLLNVFIKLDIILTTHTHPYTHIDRYVNNHAVFINPIFKQYYAVVKYNLKFLLCNFLLCW